MGNLLLSSFPNLTKAQVAGFVAGLLNAGMDLNTFKLHLRDFLVTLKVGVVACRAVVGGVGGVGWVVMGWLVGSLIGWVSGRFRQSVSQSVVCVVCARAVGLICFCTFFVLECPRSFSCFCMICPYLESFSSALFFCDHRLDFRNELMRN